MPVPWTRYLIVPGHSRERVVTVCHDTCPQICITSCCRAGDSTLDKGVYGCGAFGGYLHVLLALAQH